MNNKVKKIRNIVGVILFAFGVGIFILVLMVGRNNYTEWQEPITLTYWIYLTLVMIYTVFLNAIPRIWNYVKKQTGLPKGD